MGQFEKGLSNDFIQALGLLAKTNGWWKDVLADPTLIIGIRNEKFDVYWHGQSIFNVKFDGGRVKVDTHVKYLLDPDRSDRVSLNEDDASFAFVSVPLIKQYDGKSTLKKLKTAADLFSGDEKKGVHAIARANENVIDVEVRLDATGLDTKRNQPRIDIAALEMKAGAIELVFWEAKLFANKELRISGSSSEPDVIDQINDYKKAIEARRSEAVASYQLVAKNLVAIAKMSAGERSVGPAIQAVADGAVPTIGSPPQVGLVIFGFDADQKMEGGIGHKHFEKLKEQIGPQFVRTRGEAKGLKLL